MSQTIATMIRDGVKRRVRDWAYGAAAVPAGSKSAVRLTDPKIRLLFGIGSESVDATELTDPYKQLPIVRAAIKAKAVNIAQVPFVLTKLGSEDPLDDRDPMVRLYQDVNPYLDGPDLWELSVIYLDCYGDAPTFWDQEEERAPGVPMFLWPEVPGNVRPALKNNSFVGWFVRRGADDQFFLPDQVIMPKYANPKSKLRGLSLLSALAQTNDGDWGAIRYNQLIFTNGISPGIVFETPEGVTLEDEDYERLKYELITQNEGVNAAHTAIILEGGLKANDTRKTNRDMQFIDLRKFNREDVAMVLGTPKAELQLYEDVNYATAQSADRSFWKKTLIPLMSKLASKHNVDFLNPRGYRGYFDIRQVDVLNQEVLEKASTAQIFVNMGYTLNQVNARLNLGFAEVAWGDEPREITPIPDDEVREVRDVTPEPKAIEDINSEIRRKKWLDLVKQIQPTVGAMSADVRNYFKKIERKILRRLIKRPADGVVEVKAPVDDDYGWIRELFEDTSLYELTLERQKEAAQKGVNSVQLEIDGSPIISVQLEPDPIINLVIASRGADKIQDINSNASKYLVAKLRKILNRGIEEGWTEERLAQEVVAGMKGSMENIIRRSRTIARTEVHGAFSSARYGAQMTTDPVRMRWLSTRDDKVREKHLQMNGETTEPGQSFSNGLRFPLDPNPPNFVPAKEVINCRCVSIAEYE